MTHSEQAQFTGFEVELSRIEKEFQKIWEKTTDNSNPNAVIKASTLNLVITCNTAEWLPAILQMVPEITLHHPGRIILVYINPHNQSEQIKAVISAFCLPPRYDGRQICCELVSLETGLAGVKHLPGTLLPLLLPDLPVFLWSPNNLVLNSPSFQNFYKNIDRVILQSPESFMSTSALQELSKAILQTARMSKVSDMSWAALTGWREAIAGFFDGQECWHNLQNISSIAIRYHGKGVSLPAYLLAAWLVFLLKWQFKTGNEPHYTFITPQGRQLDIRFEQSTSTEYNKGIETVTITSEQENDRRLVYVAEKTTHDKITATAYRNEQPLSMNTIPCPPVDKARQLCAELDYLHEDRVYLGAIQIIHKTLNADADEKSRVY